MTALAAHSLGTDDDTGADLTFDCHLYVFEEGSSHKFWARLVHGTTYIAWWGRVGQNGQCKAKQYPSPIAALTAAQDVEHKKQDKGYYMRWKGTIALDPIYALMLDDDSANVIPPANLSEALLEAAPHDPRES